MKMKSKSFPKLHIFLLFLILFLQFCQKEEALLIDKEQFIEIYARLLIINELRVNKSDQDRLLNELYTTNNVSLAEIDSTVSYFNSHPREWVEIYNRVREKIQKIKSDYQIDSSKNIDSLISKSKSKISTKSIRKSFIGDENEKKARNPKGEKKSIEENQKKKSGNKKSDQVE
jgi:hypothetical protein